MLWGDLSEAFREVSPRDVHIGGTMLSWVAVKRFCFLGVMGLLLAVGCTSLDDVGGDTILPDPPVDPILDTSVPTEVMACDTPGCRNIVLITGTKATRVGIMNEAGSVLAPVSEVTTFGFDFELTQTMNRVAVRAFDQDNQTSGWVSMDIELVTPVDETDPTDDEPGGGHTVPAGDLTQITQEADTFNSLHPRMALGADGLPIVVWQSCRATDACDRPRVLVSRQLQNGIWSTPTVVSSDDIGSANALSPDLTVDESGTVHVVWVDDGSVGFRGNVADVIHRTWDTTVGGGLGIAKSVTQLHTPTDAVVDAPVIAANGTVIRVAYMARAGGNAQREYEVFAAQLEASGTWTVSQVSANIFDEGAGHSGATHPEIEVDSEGRSHIVWQNARERNAEFTDKTDVHYFVSGSSGPWLVNEVCDSTEPRNAHSPSLAVDKFDAQNRVYVTWIADGGCRAQGQTRSVHLAYTEGTMGAFDQVVNPVSDFAQFGSSRNRTPVVSLLSQNDIPVAERFVLVAFVTAAAVDGSGEDDDIVVRKLSRAGSPVGEVVVVSEADRQGNSSVEKSREPSLQVDAQGNAHVVWQEWDSSEADADYDLVYGVAVP